MFTGNDVYLLDAFLIKLELVEIDIENVQQSYFIYRIYLVKHRTLILKL